MTGRKGAKVRRNAAIVRVRKPDPLTECQSGIERPGPSPVWIESETLNKGSVMIKEMPVSVNVVLTESALSAATIKDQIETAVEESKRIAGIESADDLNVASQYLKSFSKLGKNIEMVRKTAVGPIYDKVSEINSFFKAIVGIYSDEKARLKRMLLAYEAKRQQEEAIRQRAERERREAAAKEEAWIEKAKLEKERAEKAEFLGIDEKEIDIPDPMPVIVPEIIHQELKLSNLNTAGIGTARKKTWTLVDIDAVPRQYLIIDERKIKEIRMSSDFDATSPIPGIEFGVEMGLRT